MRIIQIHDPVRAVGLLAPLLSAHDPFRSMSASNLVHGLRDQVVRRHTLVAVEGSLVKGFFGWGLASEEIGRAWSRGEASPKPEELRDGDAVLLMAVWANGIDANRRLSKQLRLLYPGRLLFARRVKPDTAHRAVELRLSARPSEFLHRAKEQTPGVSDEFEFLVVGTPASR